MEAGPENGTEHRSAPHSLSASCPWRSAASASSAASSLVASCSCSAESRCMQGAARRTRSRGTRSCIAFLRPVEDQTHTKVWSEGRAVQPPSHPMRGGHRDPHRTKADSSLCLLQADMDFSAGSCDLSAICQPCVSGDRAASRCSVQWAGLRPAPHTAPSSTAIQHAAQLLGVEHVVAGVAAVIYVWT